MSRRLRSRSTPWRRAVRESNRRASHAIVATSARWRGGVVSLDRCEHPTHWLISAQAAIQKRPEDAVKRARDSLMQTVRRCSDAGLGAASVDVRAIREEAEALSVRAREADRADRPRPGRGYAPSIFDARRFAGAWDVLYSSAVAGATASTKKADSSVVKYLSLIHI